MAMGNPQFQVFYLELSTQTLLMKTIIRSTALTSCCFLLNPIVAPMRLKPFMPCGPYNRYNKSCQYLERAPSNQSESNVIEY